MPIKEQPANIHVSKAHGLLYGAVADKPELRGLLLLPIVVCPAALVNSAEPHTSITVPHLSQIEYNQNAWLEHRSVLEGIWHNQSSGNAYFLFADLLCISLPIWWRSLLASLELASKRNHRFSERDGNQ